MPALRLIWAFKLISLVTVYNCKMDTEQRSIPFLDICQSIIQLPTVMPLVDCSDKVESCKRKSVSGSTEYNDIDQVDKGELPFHI